MSTTKKVKQTSSTMVVATENYGSNIDRFFWKPLCNYKEIPPIGAWILLENRLKARQSIEVNRKRVCFNLLFYGKTGSTASCSCFEVEAIYDQSNGPNRLF